MQCGAVGFRRTKEYPEGGHAVHDVNGGMDTVLIVVKTLRLVPTECTPRGT